MKSNLRSIMKKAQKLKKIDPNILVDKLDIAPGYYLISNIPSNSALYESLKESIHLGLAEIVAERGVNNRYSIGNTVLYSPSYGSDDYIGDYLLIHESCIRARII
jgi:hypothetical protein